ncbi:MAG: DNA primase [Erysipelotrichaceae bacterium]|nr:DNA primase [Erysipelotrichaceae bacterium]
MNISNEVIDDIRNSASISEVIRACGLDVIKKGKGYAARCPFHDDHDPSLSINEEKQIFKCFVCGQGGNVFTFVQKYEHLSFPEAVVRVANIINKPIDVVIEKKPKSVSKYQRYYDCLGAMATYGNYLLTGSKMGDKALEYLKSRGIEDDVINHFNIGLDPAHDSIVKYLNKQGFTNEEIIKSYAGRLNNSGLSDIFFKRIIFPIHDKDGNCIAFSGRDYTGSFDSKYINSSETAVYVKGNTIYNYHRAKDACRKLGYVIVCEGVMDVIAFYRAGIENVVATLGTACTKQQLALLSVLSPNIVLAYDGDKAGMHANMALGEMCLANGLKVSAIDNATGLDPDEIIGQYGKNSLRDLLSARIPFMDYALKYYKNHYNLDNYQDRKDMTSAYVRLIELLKDPYDRENYANELYQLTKIRKRPSVIEKKGAVSTNSKPNFSIDGLTKAEYAILSMISQSPAALQKYQRELGYLLDENNEKLAMAIIDDYRRYGKCSLSRIYDEREDETLRDLITNLAAFDSLDSAYDEDVLNGAISRVIFETKKRKLALLKEKIAQNKTVDPEAAVKYLDEYATIIKQLGGNNDE